MNEREGKKSSTNPLLSPILGICVTKIILIFVERERDPTCNEGKERMGKKRSGKFGGIALIVYTR